MKQSIGLNIAKLFTSNIAVQALVVLTTPAITHLFSPAQFGVMQILESMTLLCFCLAGLKYELAIPLEKEPQPASAAFILSVGLAGVVGLLSFAGILVTRHALAIWFHTPELTHLLWLLPIAIVLYGLFNPLMYWAAWEGRFGAIAWANMANSLSERLFSILGGVVLSGSIIGLIIGRFAGMLAQTLLLVRHLNASILVTLRAAHLSWALIAETACKHKNLPLFKTWEVFLTTLSLQLQPLIFGHYFSPDVVGQLALALKVVALPATLFGNAVAQVFLPAAATARHETGTFAPVVQTMLARLIQLSLFPMLVLGLFGPVLFQLVFGARWQEAGRYAQLFAAWQFLGILYFPLDIFTLVNRQPIGLLLTTINVGLKMTSLLVGVMLGPPILAIGLFVIAGVFFLTGALGIKLQIAQVSKRWVVREILKYLGISLAWLLPCQFFYWWTTNRWLLMFTLLCAAGGYLGVLIRQEPEIRQRIAAHIAFLLPWRG